jgi:TatD DNase family protein
MVLALVDTHCHIGRDYFAEGPEEVMRRAHLAGVTGFVVVGVGSDLQPARDAVALARQNPENVVACVGVHPHDATSYRADLASELRALAQSDEVAAVGEIGLDYHYDHSPRTTQRDVFAQLIALARELGKPIVVHTREAASDTLDILEREQARDVGGIIHCFSEDRPFAERALALGFDLSFSGIVTFKSARAIQEVASWAPLERILIETDSPYLAPVPLRGQKCEPAMLVHTAKRVAELRSMPLEELAEMTRGNAERRFGRSFAKAREAGPRAGGTGPDASG